MIPFVVGLALVGTADAVEPQYRQLRLVDGRELVAQIVSTESDGLSLELPQGNALVPFDLLVDMLPSDALSYQSQPDWSVWVLTEDAGDRAILLAAFGAIDGVRAMPVGEGVPDAIASQARGCGFDVECVARVSEDSGWRWIVLAQRQGTDLRLTSRTTSTTNPTTIDIVAPPKRLDRHVHELLALVRPYEPPPSIAVDPVVADSTDETDRKTPTIAKTDRRRVVAQSFVPLPGYPSLKRGDTKGFFTAMGLVVPATAIWVGAVGQGSQNAGEFTALSVAGFYGATVLTNQVIGKRTLQRQAAALSVAPTERGGTQLLVGARF